MGNLYQAAQEFIREYGLNSKNFFWKFNEMDKDSVMIHIPNQEVYSFDIGSAGFGEDNFDDCNGKSANVTNWSCKPDGKFYFYNKYFPVVNSTFDELVIKIDENIYATVVRGMVYEWDDLK